MLFLQKDEGIIAYFYKKMSELMTALYKKMRELQSEIGHISSSVYDGAYSENLYFCRKFGKVNTVKIDIELPSSGCYSEKELTELIYSYALSLVMPDSVSDKSVEEEMSELNRRAAEMTSNSSVCIPHEEVYDRVMSRLNRYETHLA